MPFYSCFQRVIDVYENTDGTESGNHIKESLLYIEKMLVFKSLEKNKSKINPLFINVIKDVAKIDRRITKLIKEDSAA